MKFLRLVSAAVMGVMSTGVSAKTVTIDSVYVQSIGFDSPAPTLLSYKEFTPSMGTLNRVDISKCRPRRPTFDHWPVAAVEI